MVLTVAGGEAAVGLAVLVVYYRVVREGTTVYEGRRKGARRREKEKTAGRQEKDEKRLKRRKGRKEKKSKKRKYREKKKKKKGKEM